MPDPVKIAFSRQVVSLPLSDILPMRRVPDGLKQTARYKRIVASIGEVGIVEPLVVARRGKDPGPFMLVDDHLRHAALLDLGTKEAPCVSPMMTRPLPTTSGSTGWSRSKSTT
jgi:ParB-like chromosome segregation protein Spo0J